MLTNDQFTKIWNIEGFNGIRMRKYIDRGPLIYFLHHTVTLELSKDETHIVSTTGVATPEACEIVKKVLAILNNEVTNKNEVKIKRFILKKDLSIRRVINYNAITDTVCYEKGWCKAKYVLKTSYTLTGLCDVFVVVFNNGRLAFETNPLLLGNYGEYSGIFGGVATKQGIIYILRYDHGNCYPIEPKRQITDE